MTEIRTYAIKLCVCFVISSFVLFVCPEGSLKKILRYIVSLFILSVVFIPFQGIDFSGFPQYEIDAAVIIDEEYSYMLSEYIYSSSEEIINDALRSQLDKICQNEYFIEIFLNERNSGEIAVSRIVIKISGADIRKTAQIRKITGELTGIIPEVIIDELQSNN